MKRLALAIALVLSLAASASAIHPYRYQPRTALGAAYLYGTPYPSLYGSSGYFAPGIYQPYSYSVTPGYGGSIYQYNSGAFYYAPWTGYMGFGAYVPYSGAFYAPSYPAYGWGVY